MSLKDKKYDFNSIRFRIWTCFVILGLTIVLIIWFLQMFLIDYGYKNMKVSDVNKIASSIYSAYTTGDTGLSENLERMSLGNDYYIMMEYDGALLLFTPEEDSVAPVYKYRDQIPKLKELLIEIDHDSASGDSSFGNKNNSKNITDDFNKYNQSNIHFSDNSVSFEFSTHYDEYSTLAYCQFLENSDEHEILLYIFTPLYPLDSTIGILQDMLMTVMIISLLLALILAIFISRRLSSPIKQITNSARLMGTGDYNVKFEASSYTEINELANTLNVTAYELGLADTRQKDLVANVSHDLKTPLTMIRSYAEMIRDLSGDIPEKRNNHLQVIMDESDKMTRLISDMATMCAMNTHKLELNKTHFDIGEVTASVLASYAIYQDQNGYDFRFALPKDKTCYVYADEARIRQVLSNFIENAIKYCGEDKVIKVSIRKIDKRYRIEISDHGPGISPEEIPHVWDRYYRASSNYVRPTEGTGLGLSIVKEILTLHHAAYGVRSKIDKGTTFWFDLDISKNRTTED